MQTFVAFLVLSIAFAATALPHGSRIIGGSDAPAGKYPYQVSLWKPNDKFQCGGSIINERYILTAAHCVERYEADDITVRIGSQLLNETGQIVKSEKLIWHKNYNTNFYDNDIALIRLAEKIVYTDKIQPIPLPTEDFTQENYAVVLSGWGRLYAGGPQPNSLQEIELRTLAPNECKASLPVFSKQICTLTVTGEGACNGDSGGPLVVNGVEIGIVSYGVPCGVGVPDVYTRVYSYLDWIAANMNLE